MPDYSGNFSEKWASFQGGKVLGNNIFLHTDKKDELLGAKTVH